MIDTNILSLIVSVIAVLISIYAITSQNKGVVFEHRLLIYIEVQTIYDNCRKIVEKCPQIDFQRQKGLIAMILFGFNTAEADLIKKYLDQSLSKNDGRAALLEYLDINLSKHLDTALLQDCKIFFNEKVYENVEKLYSMYKGFRLTFLASTEEEMTQSYQEMKLVLDDFQEKKVLKKMKRKLPI